MPAVNDLGQAMEQASQNELIQRKLQMDALRKRLGDGRDEKQKLRESCEGFEAIFLQKMWEQMRKNVSKEGYLHSKDEEAYQSMFDVELCKKMTEAGGIGLADMLYEQLSQKLDHAGRTTSPGTYRPPVTLPPTAQALKPAEADKPVEKLTAENLYSEPEAATRPVDPEERTEPEKPKGILEIALSELASAVAADDARAAETNKAEQADEVKAAQAFAAQAAAAGTAAAEAAPAGALPAAGQAVPSAEPGKVGAADMNGDQAKAGAAGAPRGAADEAPKQAPADRKSRKNENLHGASWIGHGPVSAEPKPLSRFKRPKNLKAASEAAPAKASLPADGPVVEGFGWTQSASGGRRWNNGLDIAAAPGSPVRAVLPGTVAFVGEQQGMGSLVVLEHEGGLRSYYSGIRADGLAEGAKISGGANFAVIAAQPGSEAQAANSALLHFEIKRGEMALNPESVLGNTPGRPQRT